MMKHIVLFTLLFTSQAHLFSQNQRLEVSLNVGSSLLFRTKTDIQTDYPYPPPVLLVDEELFQTHRILRSVQTAQYLARFGAATLSTGLHYFFNRPRTMAYGISAFTSFRLVQQQLNRLDYRLIYQTQSTTFVAPSFIVRREFQKVHFDAKLALGLCYVYQVIDFTKLPEGFQQYYKFYKKPEDAYVTFAGMLTLKASYPLGERFRLGMEQGLFLAAPKVSENYSESLQQNGFNAKHYAPLSGAYFMVTTDFVF